MTTCQRSCQSKQISQHKTSLTCTDTRAVIRVSSQHERDRVQLDISVELSRQKHNTYDSTSSSILSKHSFARSRRHNSLFAVCKPSSPPRSGRRRSDGEIFHRLRSRQNLQTPEEGE
eukprot:79245-Hanusia_phi.AAC.1